MYICIGLAFETGALHACWRNSDAEEAYHSHIFWQCPKWFQGKHMVNY